MGISSELFDRAQSVIPGGVNSPVRAFKGVGGTPVFFDRGKGSYVYDVDGNAYIDYVNSWGPLILGHANPQVIATITDTIQKGLSFGVPTALEVQLAEKICQLMPSIEQIRMVNSGTEATMSALRLARGYTKRNKIIKFVGCYHGHADPLLVKAGSGGLTFGVPDSAGVPESYAQHTINANFNNLDSVQQIFQQCGQDIAAIIVEPVAGNMNCVPPSEGFLQGLRDLCDQHQSLLIFDEVMTGFRVALGGAQQKYGVTPDITTLAKVIGGGMPVGAFGGRQDIMNCLSPLGPVYQAGTLSGNPVAMAAGLATLQQLEKPGIFQAIEANTAKLVQGISECARSANIPLSTNQAGTMFGIFFTEDETITRFDQVMACDIERFKQVFHGMLDQGVYLAPSAFETGFVNSTLSDDDITKTLTAFAQVFDDIAKT